MSKEEAVSFLKFALAGFIHGDINGDPSISDFNGSGADTPEDVYELFVGNALNKPPRSNKDLYVALEKELPNHLDSIRKKYSNED